MKPLEILDDLYFIERGLLNGNHFVYRSKQPVLIDTAYKSGFNETEKAINKSGVNVEDVSLIINTHCHCDHIGGNKLIQERSGCNIAMHEIGRHFINTKNSWSTWWKYYNQEADFFDCTISLLDDEIINIGPFEFLVIHTPGHAVDGIVLYNKKHKILLSSDTLWEKDMAVMTLRIEGSDALFNMRDSLEKISSLDVDTVYPGHGSPFSDFAAAIDRAKSRIKRFMDEPESLGNDLLKKIMVYTLMMNPDFKEDYFYDYLMGTFWYRETVDLYFNGQFENKYHEILKQFMSRGVVVLKKGLFSTTVKP